MLQLAYCKHLITSIPKWLIRVSVSKIENSLHLYVHSAYVVQLFYFLRDNCSAQYKGFIDLCCTDYPSDPNRFKLIYQLLSFRYNVRIFVHVETSEVMPIESVTSIFLSANWFEREAWDLYGIY